MKLRLSTFGAFSAALLLPAFSIAAGELERLAPAKRLEREQLKAAFDARQNFARERQAIFDKIPNHGLYNDYRAVLNVCVDGNSDAARQAVLDAAKKAGVNVVLLCGPAAGGDTRSTTGRDAGATTGRDAGATAEPAKDAWHGLREGVLFLSGVDGEIDSALRLPEFGPNRVPMKGRDLSFAAAASFKPGLPAGGLKICDARVQQSALGKLLGESQRDTQLWPRLLDGFKTYPDEFFNACCDYDSAAFARWDSAAQKGACAAVGSCCARQALSIGGTVFDPYELAFRSVCTHILAADLSEPEIRRALRDGNAYVAHDWLCDPTGFLFGVGNNFGVFPMGDKAQAMMGGSSRIIAFTPAKARLKLFHNGKLVQESIGTTLEYNAKAPGAYRLEAWLKVGAEERPWIYSNPVYLQEQTLTSLMAMLPSSDFSPKVDVKKDITYAAGKPEDEAKHKLDLYLPLGTKKAPVFVFIHGGAWRTGDRLLYLPAGYRFAKEGILTVLPSYRLAPKNPHPAQIEDSAAALAWVIQHIAEYGGDPERIYVGGHSAGGHLAALLALDESHLKKYNLSPKNIKGVIALSGVYDLVSIGESQASVFGKDEAVRKAASPLFHVKPAPAAGGDARATGDARAARDAAAPPFLIGYCQWDYPTLPWQARQLQAALQKVGASTQMLYVPQQTHISEMVNVAQEDDPTARAILKFIK